MKSIKTIPIIFAIVSVNSKSNGLIFRTKEDWINNKDSFYVISGLHMILADLWQKKNITSIRINKNPYFEIDSKFDISFLKDDPSILNCGISKNAGVILSENYLTESIYKSHIDYEHAFSYSEEMETYYTNIINSITSKYFWTITNIKNNTLNFKNEEDALLEANKKLNIKAINNNVLNIIRKSFPHQLQKETYDKNNLSILQVLLNVKSNNTKVEKVYNLTLNNKLQVIIKGYENQFNYNKKNDTDRFYLISG